MNRKRFFTPFPWASVIFGILFVIPVSGIAQTSTGTSTPEKSGLQQQVDALIQRRINQISSPAQIRANAIRDYLETTITPRYPKPNEIIKINIQSYLTDLNKATISWFVNGTLVSKGIGKKFFSFTNGKSGSATKILVTIHTNVGDVVTKEFIFNPIGVTVLWEADTYTPPFYKGKALASPQSDIRAIAIPDTGNAKNILGAGNLVYVWKKNGTGVQEASGLSKNSFTFLAPKPYQEINVGVQISSLDTDIIQSETKVNVPLVSPFILFYEKHPLEGIHYGRPLPKTFTLSGKEITLRGEPYFFSNESGNKPTISHQWSLNGRPTQNQGRTITLRNDKGVSGGSEIGLVMQGVTKTFQSSNQSVVLRFGENNIDTKRPSF